MTDEILPNPPVLPTGQEIFDIIMGDIEPDLVSDAAETLDQKYAGESPEQKAGRMARYQAAFAEYDVQYKEYMDAMNAEVNAYRQEALKLTEQNSQKKDETELQSLEAAFAA